MTTGCKPSGDDEWQMRVDAHGALVSWGARLQDVFGYTEADVVGRKVDMLIPRILRAKHWKGFNKAVALGKMRRPNKTFRSVGLHKDGHLVAFRSVDILEFAEDGTVESVRAIILRQGWRSLLEPVQREPPQRLVLPR